MHQNVSVNNKRPQSLVPDTVECPEDAQLISQMQIQYSQCRRKANPYQAPEQQMRLISETAILREILLEGRVRYDALRGQLEKRYGKSFSRNEFDSAWNSISDHLKNRSVTA